MEKGNLVRIRATNRNYPDEGRIGIVTWIDMTYPTRCSILIDGEDELYDPRSLEVINESR